MEIYHDSYGGQACIRISKNGGARLTVHAGGKTIHAKDYVTYRGAKIAMGRMSDTWRRVGTA